MSFKCDSRVSLPLLYTHKICGTLQFVIARRHCGKTFSHKLIIMYPLPMFCVCGKDIGSVYYMLYGVSIYMYSICKKAGELQYNNSHSFISTAIVLSSDGNLRSYKA